MSSVFLVMAHRDPDQVARLAGDLVGSSRRVYLHLDAAVAPDPFRRALAGRLGTRSAEVRWVADRVRVRWGGLSLVRAAFGAARQAFADGPVARATLLSGACRLVRPVDELDRLDPHTEYLRVDRVITPAGGFQAEKLSRRWFDDSRLLARLGGRLPRRWPAVLPPIRQGAVWWSLTGDGLAYVLAAADRRPALLTALQHAHCADEMVVPTLIADSAYGERVSQRYDLDPAAAEGVSRHGLHYLRWHQGAWSPDWLTAADLPAIRASGAYFARKVDSVRSADLLPA